MKSEIIKKPFCCLIIILLLLVAISACIKNTVESEDDNTVTISPQGGEYTFPNGMKLHVPVGAVTENKDITLKKIDNSQLIPIFNKRGVSIDNLLVGIQGMPEGIIFSFPIQLILNIDIEPGEIPIIHEVNLSSGSYTPAEVELSYDPEQDTLVISVRHFSAFFVEKQEEFNELLKGCGEAPCRCGRIKVEQGDKVYICENGECQISETKVNITFLDCQRTLMEECVLREVSAGCIPNLKVSAGNTIVSTNGVTTIKAEVNIGCEPIEGQSVNFLISGPATLNPVYSTTNVNGEALTTFSAGDEEGMVTVTAESTINYYTYNISASAGSQQNAQHETINGPLITRTVSKSVAIEIKKLEEKWSGTITYEGDYPHYCNSHFTYNINFVFIVSEPDNSNERSINGTATAEQQVTLSAEDPCWTCQNLDAPNTVDLVIFGRVVSDDNLYVMILEKPDYSAFYTYDCCYFCRCDIDECGCSQSFQVVSSLMLGSSIDEDFFLPLRDGSYSYTSIDLQYPSNVFSYTITLNREQ